MDGILEDLRMEIARGRAIAIIGAGVSIASTGGNALASWSGLLKHGVDYCLEFGHPPPRPDWARRQHAALADGDLLDWLGVAEQVERRLRNNDQFYTWARKTVGSLRVTSRAVLEAIRDLDLVTVTTNYDDLIEQVTDRTPVTLLEWNRALRVLKKEGPGILHLHGHWENPDSMVLGVISYDRHITNPRTQAFQQALFFANSIVFIGCGAGLDDPNFRKLQAWLRRVLGGDQRHYRLCLDGEIDSLKDDQEPGNPIFPIAYGSDHSHLAAFLQTLAPRTASSHHSYRGSKFDGSLAPSNLEDPGLCIGREVSICSLVRAFSSSSGPCSAIVFGGPGFGKTMITQKVAINPHIIARFGVRRWFIKLENVRAARDVTDAIAAEIGLAPAPGKDVVIAQLGRQPSLLVLDNLETPLYSDPGDMDTLLRELRAEPNLALIASLRGDEPPVWFQWDVKIPIDTLDDQTSRSLFLEIAGTIRKDDPDLDFFLAWTAGIPLAIKIVAACAAGHATLERLRNDWRRVGRKAIVTPIGGRTRDRDLMVCIEFSLKLPVLKAAGRRLFSLLGQLPAGIAKVDEDGLLGKDAAFAPRQLRLAGLLREHENRLDLLPPIREAALTRRPSDVNTHKWVSYYITVAREQSKIIGKDGGAAAVARLAAELPNIGAAMVQLATTQAGRAEAVAVLAGGLSEAMRYTRVRTDAMLEILADSCKKDQDWKGEVVCLIAQANAARASDVERALRCLNLARDRLSSVHDNELSADCLLGFARVAQTQDKRKMAIDYYEKAREQYVRARYEKGEADCLWGLAEIARQQEQYEEALGRYQRGLALYTEVGWVTGVAACLWGLAEIARQQERYEEARSHYEDARKQYTCVGWLAGDAYCDMGLAAISERIGERDQACRLYIEAEAIFRKTAMTQFVQRVGCKLRELACVSP
jgi:tetratricopeptide (TPR) repeat protein